MAARPEYDDGWGPFINRRGDEGLHDWDDEETFIDEGPQESQHLGRDQFWSHMQSQSMGDHSLDFWSDSTVDQPDFTPSSTFYSEPYRVPNNTPRQSPRQVLLQRQYPDFFRSPVQPPVMSAPLPQPQSSEIDKFPPFDDPTKSLNDCPFGVLKIKNIPFSVTLQEVIHFINRISGGGKIIEAHVYGYPVHVLIERATGKTLDCFVEMMSVHDAMLCISRIESMGLRSNLKIGQRRVDIDLSSQGELMSELFPRAKNVVWDINTGLPQIVPNDDPDSEGYRGIFTIEEIASIVKFAETPQRSPFSVRCLQRPFENMISTLYKFPWKASAQYTVAARDFLFTAYTVQLQVLYTKVHPQVPALLQYNRDTPTTPRVGREVGLSHHLLMDLLFAGLNCATFSMRQKAQIVASCGSIGNGFPLTPHAFNWPFTCLSPSFKTPDTLLIFWLTIISTGYNAALFTDFHNAFDRYLKTYRDDNGYLTFRFTRLGSCLPFRQCVIIEQSLAKQFIEKGRIIWCREKNVPYVPFEYNLPSEDQILKDAEASLAVLNLDADIYEDEPARPSQSQPTQAAQLQQNGYGQEDGSTQSAGSSAGHLGQVNRIAEQRTQADTLSSQLSQLNLQQLSTTSSMHPDSTIDLNPQMPEFVPSHQWSQYQQQQNYIDTARAHPMSDPGHHSAFANSGTMPGLHQGRPTTLQDYMPNTQTAQHLTTPTQTQQYQADDSSDNATSNGHGPIGSSMSPRKAGTRRRTINIDSTIDEEHESHQDDEQGGVRLPTSMSDRALSTRKYE